MSDRPDVAVAGARSAIHEIRGELASIRGHAGLLRRHELELDAARRESFAENIDDAGQRIDALVNRLAGALRLGGALRSALDAVEGPLCIVDAAGNVAYANPAQVAAWPAADVAVPGTALRELVDARTPTGAAILDMVQTALTGEAGTVPGGDAPISCTPVRTDDAEGVEYVVVAQLGSVPWRA